MNSKKNASKGPSKVTTEISARRRDFLKGLLRSAAYVGPVVAVMSVHSLKSAAQSGPGNPHP